MQNIKKYSIIAILTLSVVAGIFNNIPLSYAQGNSTMANATLAYAQNDTMSMANMTEGKKNMLLLLRQAIQQKKKKKNIMKQML